jgi:hypothetical protein
MVTASSSDALITTYQTTWFHSPEDHILNLHHHNMKVRPTPFYAKEKKINFDQLLFTRKKKRYAGVCFKMSQKIFLLKWNSKPNAGKLRTTKMLTFRPLFKE